MICGVKRGLVVRFVWVVVNTKIVVVVVVVFINISKQWAPTFVLVW